MSLRFPLVALAALTLTGCDLPGQTPKAAAPAKVATTTTACCCKVCPTDAAPSDGVAAVGDTRSSARTVTRQVAHKPAKAQGRRDVALSRTYAAAPRARPAQSREYARPDRREVLAGGSYARRDDRYGGAYGYGEREEVRSERGYAERGYAQRDTRRAEGGYGQRYSEQSTGRYERSDHGYGGRYGASGRVTSGVSVSVEETESYAERRRYSESSSSYAASGYASGGGAYRAGYASGHARVQPLYYEDRDGRVRRGGPAGTDRAGYLTWPGKVED